VFFQNRPPGHEAEAQAVLEHGEAATGEHEGAAIDAAYALSVLNDAMLHAGLTGDLLRGRFDLAAAQGREQVAGEEDAMAAPLGETLIDKVSRAIALVLSTTAR